MTCRLQRLGSTPIWTNPNWTIPNWTTPIWTNVIWTEGSFGLTPNGLTPFGLTTIGLTPFGLPPFGLTPFGLIPIGRLADNFPPANFPARELVWGGEVVRSGTCPGGSCQVWNLSRGKLSGIHIRKCTFLIRNVPPTLRPKCAQKPSNGHTFPKCWQNISNAN